MIDSICLGCVLCIDGTFEMFLGRDFSPPLYLTTLSSRHMLTDHLNHQLQAVRLGLHIGTDSKPMQHSPTPATFQVAKVRGDLGSSTFGLVADAIQSRHNPWYTESFASIKG
jgi:hypothetical protein